MNCKHILHEVVDCAVVYQCTLYRPVVFLTLCVCAYRPVATSDSSLQWTELTMPVIKLQSSDGEIFEVEVEIAKTSNILETMIEGST